MRAYHVWVLTAVIVVLGGAILVLGELSSIDSLKPVGLMVIAAAPIVVGLHAAISGRLVLPLEGRHDWEKFRGAGARATGMVFVLFGVFLFTASLMQLLGPVGVAFDTSGWLLAGLGAMAILGGIGQTSKTVIHKGRAIASFRMWPDRISGFLLIAIGIVVLGAGLLDAYSPELFLRLRRSLFEHFLSTAARLMK